MVLKGLWQFLCYVRKRDTYISNILINNGYGIMHRQDSIFPVGEIQFEGKTFSAPHNPDAYLKDLYRDYMTVPPEEKRKIHAIFVKPELIKKSEED
jgi:lipopolysaccharide cholinephosphotransferase